MSLPDWIRAHGGPAGTGLIRAEPEDFEVEEIPRIRPSGEGSHLWLWVEKRGANTEWVARQLARVTGCAARDVGYAGMKDRHAVTRQWFSVPNSGQAPAVGAIDGVDVLDAVPHGRKLKRGTLDGNRFRLRIRAFDGDREAFDARLDSCREKGVPNYFGPQRFGRGGANIGTATAWIASPSRIQRAERSRHLSVLRSMVFNHVLAARVAGESWNRLLTGEQAVLDGSRSLIHCDPLIDDLEARCEAFDLHPTGPLVGKGGPSPSGAAGRAEQEPLQPWQPICDGLSGQGVEGARRSLRLAPRALECEWREDGPVLKFELPAGAYATALLRELLDFREPGGDTAAPPEQQQGNTQT